MADFMWHCPCCLDVGTPPIVFLSCTHNFCEICITTCAEDEAILGQLCPVCRMPNEYDSYKVNEYLTFLAQENQKEDSFEKEDFCEKEQIERLGREKFNYNTSILKDVLLSAQRNSDRISRAKDVALKCYSDVVKVNEENFQKKLQKLIKYRDDKNHQAQRRYDTALTKCSLDSKQNDANIDVLDMNVRIRESLGKQEDNIFQQHQQSSDDFYRRLLLDNSYPFNLRTYCPGLTGTFTINAITVSNIYYSQYVDKYQIVSVNRWTRERREVCLPYKEAKVIDVNGNIFVCCKSEETFQFTVLDMQLNIIRKCSIVNVPDHYGVSICSVDRVLLWYRQAILVYNLNKSKYTMIDDITQYDFNSCKIRAFELRYVYYKITGAYHIGNKIYVEMTNDKSKMVVIVNSDMFCTAFYLGELNGTMLYIGNDNQVFLSYMKDSKYYHALLEDKLTVKIIQVEKDILIDSLGNYVSINDKVFSLINMAGRVSECTVTRE